MSVRKGLASVAIALAVAAPALAQAPAAQPIAPARPDPNDPNAVILDELVVVARDKGPAWWTVSNGTSTVYVMGIPSIAPKHMQWDRSVFERRLAGASQVILPYQDVRVRLSTSIGAAWNYLRLKSSTPFEETLDPALKARFAAAREKIGTPAGRYATKNAMAASIGLLIDYRDRSGLTNTDPIKLVKGLSKEAHVPIVQKAYDIAPLIGAAARTPPAAGRQCLEEVLARVEAGPALTLDSTKAWAEGDTAGALANERTYERCLALTPGGIAFDDRIKADEVAEIEQALRTPGHAIALVQLRPLLAQGGVLDRLRMAGFSVKTPGEE